MREEPFTYEEFVKLCEEVASKLDYKETYYNNGMVLIQTGKAVIAMRADAWRKCQDEFFKAINSIRNDH